MNANTGVTRWLVAPRWMVVQTGLLLLLGGIVAGQNLERLWQVLRPPAVQAGPGPLRPHAAATAETEVEPEPAPLVERPEPQAAAPRREREPAVRSLTETERWITTSAHDETRRGYSVWAVLRPGGNLIIERCRAPEGNAAPACEVVLDQVIAALDDTRIQLRNGRFFEYSLAHRDGLEVLRLSIAEELELVPGTKSQLVNHLRHLANEAPTRGKWARQSQRQRLARN